MKDEQTKKIKLMRCRFYKEIGLIIDVSYRTVGSHFRKILQRTKCNSKGEIIEIMLSSEEVMFVSTP